MADEVKKADNKSLDALKGQEIKGENVKGGISVTIDVREPAPSGAPGSG